jgi:single-strand DNA-binding protein
MTAPESSYGFVIFRMKPGLFRDGSRSTFESMNSVQLIGNLATDVELRDVADEKKVASFLLAIDRGSRDGGADFVWITAWDRQAELCAEYLSKGGRVAVDGRLKSRTWEQDGRRRDAVEVVARRVEFLTRPAGEGSQQEALGEVIPFEAATTA